MLLAGLITLVVVHWPDLQHKTGAHAQFQNLSTNHHELVFQGQPGPWGELEYTRINIQLPDNFAQLEPRALTPTRWYFPGYNAARLNELFAACGLTDQQRKELADPTIWEQSAEGIIVTPPAATILGLTASARTQLYAVLAEDGRNDFQRWPYVFRLGGFDDWFHRSGLPDATTALIRRLVYSRGTSLCFSDLPEVLPLITNAVERQQLMKTLSLNASLMMRLWVTPETDLNGLTNYWFGRGRAKDVAPLVESLAKAPGGLRLDVIHLFPPFARKLLNTYPTPPATADQPAPDCYWTAFNFFNDPPDDRYYDDAIWRKELVDLYTQVNQPTYGDLVFLVQPDGKPIHCSVYIADDVVFTKNGVSFRQPWILMKMADMLARYPVTFPVRVVYFHLTSAH